MGVFDWFKGLFVSKQFDASLLDTRSLLDFTERTLPPDVTDMALLAAYHDVPALNGPVSFIQDRLAGADIYVKVNGERNDQHEANRFITRPNAQMTWETFTKVSWGHKEIIGEWIWVWFTNEATGELELAPIPPPLATLREDGDWEFNLRNRWIVPPQMVIWEKDADLTDPMGRGKGKGHVVLDEIEIDEYAAEYTKAEFYNHARPALVIRMPGASKETRKQFKEDFYQTFRGVQGRGKPLVVGAREDIEFEEVSRALADSMVSELRKLSTDIVDQNWNIPPELRGKTDNSNRATITMANILSADTIERPRLKTYVSVLNEHVAPLFGDNVEYCFTDPAPDDLERFLEYAKEHKEDLTVNERREMLGLPPRQDGDVYLRPPDTQLVAVEAADVVEAEAQFRHAPLPPGMDGVVIRFPGPAERERLTKSPETEADEILSRLTAEPLQAATQPVYEGEVMTFATAAASSVGMAPESFHLLNPFAVEAAERFAAVKVTATTETTRAAIRSVIVEELRRGRNPHAIKARIKQTFDTSITTWRAETIARTEMNSAANAGTFAAFDIAEVPRVEWIATQDSRVRPEHAALDGVIVERGELFVADGGEARYPGDFGVAELDINCRCTIAAVVGPANSRTADARVAMWKDFDEDLDAATERFQPYVVEGLRAQEAQILAGVDDVLGKMSEPQRGQG